MTLAAAFTGTPRHPAQYVLYLSRVGDQSCMVKIFAAPYAARKFLDALLADDGLVWENEMTIRSETGIVVSTRWFPGVLRACVDHVYTAEERAWELDYQHVGHARLFRHGPDVREASEDGAVAEPRAPRPAAQPRASRDGLVTIAEIAAELGVDARDARQALRKLKVAKPAAGWAWTTTEVEAVKSQVVKALR